jgi:ABC-2 type transport system ATP-binding protein
MTHAAVRFDRVGKTYKYFQLSNVSFELATGQIMGFVGPNGAGKSTTLRILMGLVAQDSGEVAVLGHAIPRDVVAAKRDVGYVSEDMRLYGQATLAWHMNFVASIYAEWDARYASTLLKRFNLRPEQPVKSLSHGERSKAVLLLVLARRPKLLVLDEPTTGLDPVARHEILSELMDVLTDENRSILFSSHNTKDVEQISDQITFIDRGRVIDSSDTEIFLERWRRLRLEIPAGRELPALPGVVDATVSGRTAVVTMNAYSPMIAAVYENAGARVQDEQRMTLEEIFVATVMHSRKERGE